MSDWQELERNELTFLMQHRSATFDCGFGTLVTSSDAAAIPWNFIGGLHAAPDGIPAAIELARAWFADWKRTPCVKVTPASRPAEWGDELLRAGWKPRVRLTHMVFDGPAGANAAANVDVQICRDEEDVAVFSDVQSRGFGTRRGSPGLTKSTASTPAAQPAFFRGENRRRTRGGVPAADERPRGRVVRRHHARVLPPARCRARTGRGGRGGIDGGRL